MIDSFVEDCRPARERFQNLELHDIVEKTVDLLGDSLSAVVGQKCVRRHGVTLRQLFHSGESATQNSRSKEVRTGRLRFRRKASSWRWRSGVLHSQSRMTAEE